MSGAEQVESFNPLLVLIWITQLVILYWDWAQDGRILWSIPILGSFLIIQIYMVWKTNYDKMMDEQRDAQARALGGPVDVPEIKPGETNLKDLYKKSGKKTSSSPKSNTMINLNSKAVEEDE